MIPPSTAGIALVVLLLSGCATKTTFREPAVPIRLVLNESVIWLVQVGQHCRQFQEKQTAVYVNQTCVSVAERIRSVGAK